MLLLETDPYTFLPSFMENIVMDPNIEPELDIIAEENYCNGDTANPLKVMKGTMVSCLTNPFRLLYAAHAYLNTRKRGKYINPVNRSHIKSASEYPDAILLALKHVASIRATDTYKSSTKMPYNR